MFITNCWSYYSNRSTINDCKETKSGEEEKKSSDAELDCCFCMEALDLSDALVHTGTSPTAAKVHAHCLKTWITTRPDSEPTTCPLCRTPLRYSEEPVVLNEEEAEYTLILARITENLGGLNPNIRNMVFKRWALYYLSQALIQTSSVVQVPWMTHPIEEVRQFSHAAHLLAEIEGPADALHDTVDQMTRDMDYPELKWPLLTRMLEYLRQPRYNDLLTKIMRQHWMLSI